MFDIKTLFCYNYSIETNEIDAMNSVIDIISTYETSVNQLNDQKQAVLPTLMLCGDDAQFMDAAYIIETINELKEKLPEDFSVIAARVVADLAQLHEMISDSNSLIVERNDILDEEIGDLREALDVQLAGVPESQMDRAIVIGTKHMSYDEIQILEKVYKNLKLTHINREIHKHSVYYTYDKSPELQKAIVAEYHVVLAESGLASSLKFENYVHGENIQGFTSDLVKVIKSKQ